MLKCAECDKPFEKESYPGQYGDLLCSECFNIWDLLCKAGVINEFDTVIPKCERCGKSFFDRTHCIKKITRINYIPWRGEVVIPYDFKCIEPIKVEANAAEQLRANDQTRAV